MMVIVMRMVLVPVRILLVYMYTLTCSPARVCFDFLRLVPSSLASVMALTQARVADAKSDAEKSTRRPEVTSCLNGTMWEILTHKFIFITKKSTRNFTTQSFPEKNTVSLGALLHIFDDIVRTNIIL